MFNISYSREEELEQERIERELLDGFFLANQTQHLSVTCEPASNSQEEQRPVLTANESQTVDPEVSLDSAQEYYLLEQIAEHHQQQQQQQQCQEHQQQQQQQVQQQQLHEVQHHQEQQLPHYELQLLEQQEQVQQLQQDLNRQEQEQEQKEQQQQLESATKEFEFVSVIEGELEPVEKGILYAWLNPRTGIQTHCKLDPSDPADREQKEKEEAAQAAESLEFSKSAEGSLSKSLETLDISGLLDAWGCKRTETQTTKLLELLDQRVKEAEHRDAEKVEHFQEHLLELDKYNQANIKKARIQEQQRIRSEINRQRVKEAADAAKRLTVLKKDIDHQLRVQEESETKWLEEQAEKDREAERQEQLKRSEAQAKREREKEQKLLAERRVIEEEQAERKRQLEQVASEQEQQRQRFMQHQWLHTEAFGSQQPYGEANHLYPHEYSNSNSSTTFLTASSSGSSLMQNDMVSIPMANLNGGLKAASGTAGGSATGGGVRYFSQFSKGGGVSGVSSSSSTTTTLMQQHQQPHQHLQHQQQQLQPRKLMANGDLYANGRVAVVTKAMRIKTEQQDLLDSLTVIKPEVITKMEPTAVPPLAQQSLAVAETEPEAESESETEADTQSAVAAAAPITESPLALPQAAAETDDPELDIVINNVVCSFSVRCHLKLRYIALNGCNVEYRRENGMVTMKLRRPYTTASIWSSGRITCTGATSEIMAKVAARRYARCLGKLGFPTRFQNFRIVNVLGTCSMPWAIKIVNFSEKHRDNASYEPELHPGVTYKMKMPKATLKIFSTGSITVTAASVNDVESAIQHIYPLVHEFRKQRSPEELQHLRAKQNKNAGITGTPAAATTDASETRALEDQKSKTAAEELVNVAVNNVQRLKQIESYRNMTDAEHRHIPYPRDKPEAAAGVVFPTQSTPSAPSGDNICANARRRATECWATKLQNKRPRYNDPSIVPAGKATTTATTSATTNTSSHSNPAILTSNSTTSTSGTAAITGPVLPLSSLTPIGSISGSRPFGLMAARTMIPASGTIIKIKQSCIKPLNRNALAAFTAASGGSIATAVNATATATGTATVNSSPGAAATIKKERQLSANSDLDNEIGWP